MALYFPEGINGRCYNINCSTLEALATPFLPIMNNIIENNALDLFNVLICYVDCITNVIDYYIGNPNIKIDKTNEIVRLAIDDFHYFVFYIENFDIAQQVRHYIMSGGLTNG